MINHKSQCIFIGSECWTYDAVLLSLYQVSQSPCLLNAACSSRHQLFVTTSGCMLFLKLMAKTAK